MNDRRSQKRKLFETSPHHAHLHTVSVQPLTTFRKRRSPVQHSGEALIPMQAFLGYMVLLGSTGTVEFLPHAAAETEYRS